MGSCLSSSQVSPQNCQAKLTAAHCRTAPAPSLPRDCTYLRNCAPKLRSQMVPCERNLKDLQGEPNRQLFYTVLTSRCSLKNGFPHEASLPQEDDSGSGLSAYAGTGGQLEPVLRMLRILVQHLLHPIPLPASIVGVFAPYSRTLIITAGPSSPRTCSNTSD